MHRLLSRLSYANVVATVALFLALSTGGAWAASTLISGSRIKRGTITGQQIKDGSLTGLDLAKASVTADRLAAGALTQGAKGDAGAKGDTGAKGDAGPKGDNGQKGDTGDRGPSDAYFTDLPFNPPGVALTNTQVTVHSLDLPAGKYVLSGSVTFKNSGGFIDGLVCDLYAGASFAKRAVSYAPPSGGFGQVTVDYALPLAAATTVTLRCLRDGTSTVARYASSLSAIRVATLTTS